MTAKQLPISADLDLSGLTADPTVDMFVAVGTDKATGRAVVALDAAAVAALTGLLDRFLCSDAGTYPDNDTDRASSTVATAICGPLLKLQGF